MWESIMSDDKRIGEKPVPDNVKDYLNGDQLAKLAAIERFGWTLRYIRRPLFRECVVVVMNQDGGSIGVLEEDGRLNLEVDIETRE